MKIGKLARVKRFINANLCFSVPKSFRTEEGAPRLRNRRFERDLLNEEVIAKSMSSNPERDKSHFPPLL